jgi:RNA polymerase sigma-70 factor (ECF subfamily)
MREPAFSRTMRQQTSPLGGPVTRPTEHDPAELLASLRQGDQNGTAKLMELVYDRLRAQAGAYFRDQPASSTLQPTALVHEAYVRLVGRDDLKWNDRAHFLAICAVAMRGILADHARRRNAAKRGGDMDRVPLTAIQTPGADVIDALVLDEALTRLAELSERQARIVECRFFSGMSVDEVAEALGVSKTTVEDEWRTARAWLSAHLSKGAAS